MRQGTSSADQEAWALLEGEVANRVEVGANVFGVNGVEVGVELCVCLQEPIGGVGLCGDPEV